MDLPLSEVFADAGYWIALINPREADRHLLALEVSQEIAAKRIQVITTEMVLTEFLNFFSKLGPLFRGQAAQVVMGLLHSLMSRSPVKRVSISKRACVCTRSIMTKAGDIRTAFRSRSCGSAA